jgi:hypothetical protein
MFHNYVCIGGMLEHEIYIYGGLVNNRVDIREIVVIPMLLASVSIRLCKDNLVAAFCKILIIPAIICGGPVPIR